MLYKSSRGGGAAVSFAEAIGSGYAADGGLYVPETLPAISAADLEAWGRLDFTSVAVEVLWPFVAGELSREELRSLLAGCYENFLVEDRVRVVGGFEGAERLAVAELFHGPTFCFKDLGLQVLVRFLSHFARRAGARKTLLVATTGDTGPAALRAAADVDDDELLRVVVFYPDGMVSDLQRKQMTTHASRSVRVATFDGGGDDMDAPLKRLGLDGAFAAAHGLCGANSYNVCRPLAQMVHYVWLWLRARDALRGGDGASFVLDVVVPTGAMGNLAAATFAKRRGVPLGRLCAATNENDITYRALERGDFSRAPEMRKTLSDAINIQQPYNFERVLYYALDGDAEAVAAAMADADRGTLALDAATRQALDDAGYRAARVDDDAMLAALRRFREAHGYVCDPHTAVAVAGADALGYAPYGGDPERKVPVAVVATAHPCKFEVAVKAALGDKHWAAYEASPAFPDAARALATLDEVPPLKLTKRPGEPLETAQRRWEAVVRAVLEDPDGLHAVEGLCDDDDDDDCGELDDTPPVGDDEAPSSCAIL